MASLGQICADIRLHLRTVTQNILHRGIAFEDIPDDDADVLFSYLSTHLICELYGGNFKKQVRAFTARLNVKKAAKEIDKTNLVEYDPSGIGDHQYAGRIRQKVIHSLEGVIDQSAASVTHNQYVSAAKALLEIAEKTKADAAEIMVAYESRLLILAEHLVETFLPKLGQQIKKELRAAEKQVIKKLTEDMGPEDKELITWANNDQINVWKEEIGRVIRSFELKRYELILAETMAANKQVSEAFDFTKDLIDNYKTTAEINIEDKNSAKLKQFIGKRE